MLWRDTHTEMEKFGMSGFSSSLQRVESIGIMIVVRCVVAHQRVQKGEAQAAAVSL